MNNPEIERLLDLLVDRAPKLRRAGITSIGFGDVTMTLAAAEPEAAPEVEVDDAPSGTLNDPETYGLPPGSKVPGLRRGES